MSERARRGPEGSRGRGVDKRRDGRSDGKWERGRDQPQRDESSKDRGRGRGGHRGGKGKGKGGGDRTSYGLFLWTQSSNGKWLFLSQISFSSYELNFKIDPLRGQMDPAKDDSRAHAAAREVYEETSRLVDFRAVQEHLVDFVVGKNALYCHVRVHFESLEDEQAFQRLFDQNRYEKEADLLPDEKENDSLVWCPKDFKADLDGLRFASELVKLQKTFSLFDEVYFDSLPSFVLERTTVNDFNTFVAAPCEGDAAREQSEGIVSALPHWVGEVVANRLHKRILEAARKKIRLYPQDTQEVLEKLSSESGLDQEIIRGLLENRNEAPLSVDDLVPGVELMKLDSSSSSSSSSSRQ